MAIARKRWACRVQSRTIFYIYRPYYRYRFLCVFELVVCRVRFARVSCPRLRFVIKKKFMQTIDKFPHRCVSPPSDTTAAWQCFVW